MLLSESGTLYVLNEIMINTGQYTSCVIIVRGINSCRAQHTPLVIFSLVTRRLPAAVIVMVTFGCRSEYLYSNHNILVIILVIGQLLINIVFRNQVRLQAISLGAPHNGPSVLTHVMTASICI